MRMLRAGLVACLALLSPASEAAATTLRATYTGTFGETSQTMDGVTLDGGLAPLDGKSFIAVFEYDADTMERATTASEDRLQSGPRFSLPTGTHTATLSSNPGVDVPFPTILGASGFQVINFGAGIDGIIHDAWDFSDDGTTVVESSLGISVFETGVPLGVLTPFGPITSALLGSGTFLTRTTVNGEVEFELFGGLMVESITVEVVPEVTTGWLLATALGALAACGRRSRNSPEDWS